MEEIEERVVSALSKTRLSYKVLHQMSVFDDRMEEIKVESLNREAQPLLDGEIVQASCLLVDCERVARSYRIEILDPNSMTVEAFEGTIVQSWNNRRSISNFAVKQFAAQLKDSL